MWVRVGQGLWKSAHRLSTVLGCSVSLPPVRSTATHDVHHAAASASQAAEGQAEGAGCHGDMFSMRRWHRERMGSWLGEYVARAGEVGGERLWELHREVRACTDLEGLEARAPRIGELCKWRLED